MLRFDAWRRTKARRDGVRPRLRAQGAARQDGRSSSSSCGCGCGSCSRIAGLFLARFAMRACGRCSATAAHIGAARPVRLAARAAIVTCRAYPLAVARRSHPAHRARLGRPHRPASSYEDTLTASAAATRRRRRIWRAHRARMAALLARLQARQAASAHRPLRSLRVARRCSCSSLVLLTALAGDGALERLGARSASRRRRRLAEARLDAWVTPPAYTARPPVMLADGATPLGKGRWPTARRSRAGGPEKSVVIVRAGGIGADAPCARALDAADSRARVALEAGQRKHDANDVQELRYELEARRRSARFAGGTRARQLAHRRDSRQAAQIELIEAARADAARLDEAHLQGRGRLRRRLGESEAREGAGRRAPIPRKDVGRPSRRRARARRCSGRPQLPLRLPQANAKTVENHTYFEFASHPWAGPQGRHDARRQGRRGPDGHERAARAGPARAALHEALGARRRRAAAQAPRRSALSRRRS